MSFDPAVAATLRGVSTATITTILLKQGVRRTWMHGPRPLPSAAGKRIAGPAFTLRFIPAREDLATPESWSSPKSTRAAIEDMPDGVVAVVDAMGLAGAGIFGDILCARMVQRGVAGLVTDGAVRDVAGVIGTGLPVWSAGVAAPASVAAVTFVDWQQPVGCGGIAVIPDDVIVADDDGAVVIPKAMLAEVLKAGPEQERLEAWIFREVQKGARLPGLYPPDAATKARYEAENG
ncbi:MAG: ribonuclease activity regulator RraA [Methylobacteriaceae bacterium]|nr:ribonuclease activity regulator RraA [Methylobacteriaceae bacterium]